ncbi:MAG TPA: PBP1A family penicillin-binding protein [Candidatus Limnocylindria bacterium]|nr:PBP1A family penicillin-binding protein [Candidatus Limnocylindria bacterium]
MLAGLATVFVVRLDRRVRLYLEGPAIGTTRIFAAPKTLTAGTPVAPERLVAVLERLGYAERPGAELIPGTFRRDPGAIALWQYDVRVPWPRQARRVQITLADSRVSALVPLDGGEPPRALEFRPEPLAVGGDGGSALEATAEAVPDHCRDAVLAAEDRHFFAHPGVDPIAILRALIANLTPGGGTQGGSTITQQLVKNTFLSPRRTLTRKAQEAVIALLLEARASKREILGRYLASVYLGTDGGVPIHGLAQGALVHFGKPLRDLDVAECATLAGMIRSPNRLAPRRHPDAARARRNQVLALMQESGFLDAQRAAAAKAAPIAPAPANVRPVGALYVADQVQRELQRLLPPDVARSPGLLVYTGVDSDTQHDAERAVRDGLAALARQRGESAARLQAALVAIDPLSGRIRALMGGRDYRTSQLDRTAHARRQPGSTFKPFVYLTALDPSRSGGATRTLASFLDDDAISLRAGGRLWTPANYDGTYHGPVTLPDALARSLNAATVRLALDVGIPRIARTAEDLGLTGPLPTVPSLALGAGETSLLELTAAYGVLAAGGVRRPPTLVVAVTSADGELLYTAPSESRQVVAPGVAYLVTRLLQGVMDEGTGYAARRAGLRGPLAGKTGTTDDTRDAWFVGYSPDIVAGVWVGRDEGGETGLTGATGALPIWTEFMRSVQRRYVERPFYAPPDILWREIDPQTGQLATAYCPLRRRLPFLRDTLPAETCTVHGGPTLVRHDPRERREPREDGGGGIRGFFRRLFR